MKLKIKKKYKDSQIPEYKRRGDAAADLYSYDEGVLEPGQGKSFRTGIAVEIPEGHVMLIWDRSGLAFKHGITTMGGVIDPNFRGEIGIYLYNSSSKSYTVEKGHRIAQFVIQKIELPEIKEVDELSDTDRGDKWQASSGY